METEGMADSAYGGDMQGGEMIEGRPPVGLNQRRSRAERRALGLGWFSVALGVAELTLPDVVAEVSGVRVRRRRAPLMRTTMRMLGARELASGIGIFSRTVPAVWLWSRVAGDAIDIALLGKTLASQRAERGRTMFALASVLGVTALDVLTAIELTKEARGFTASEGIHVIRAITVNRPREEVYHFWRNLENLPKFMAHLESVQVHNGRSKWRAKGPIGVPVEWDAEIVADQPNENIAWRSCEGAMVPNQGSVRFLDAPGGRGTEVRVELRYDPPTGALAATVAKLLGKEPGQQIAGDLRRFKQVIETGEVLHSDASIHAGPHPARPAASLDKVRRVGSLELEKSSGSQGR